MSNQPAPTASAVGHCPTIIHAPALEVYPHTIAPSQSERQACRCTWNQTCSGMVGRETKEAILLSQ